MNPDKHTFSYNRNCHFEFNRNFSIDTEYINTSAQAIGVHSLEENDTLSKTICYTIVTKQSLKSPGQTHSTEQRHIDNNNTHSTGFLLSLQ